MVVSLDRAGAADGGHAILPCTAAALPETVVRAGEALVAPALLLPPDMRAIASCAGLTYVQPVRVVEYTEAGTQMWLCRVAAQTHYLDRRGYAFTTLLDSAVLTCATPYERRRHGCMATVDLRDLVEDAATDGLYEQQQQRSLPITARDLVVALAPLADFIGQAPAPTPVVEQEAAANAPAISVSGPAVTVPIAVLRRVGAEALKRVAERRCHQPTLPVLLLRAALNVLWGKREVAAMANMKWEVAAIARDIAQVKALLRTWRRTWASVDVIAQYALGRSGALESCRLSLRLPVEMAA